TWYVLLRTDFTNYASELQENKFFTDEDGWGSFTAAVSQGFELLGEVVTRPTIGSYNPATNGLGQNYWTQASDSPGQGSRSVDYIDGAYIDTKWDFTGCGYYWADECQTRVGYMVDKQ